MGVTPALRVCPETGDSVAAETIAAATGIRAIQRYRQVASGLVSNDIVRTANTTVIYTASAAYFSLALQGVG
jgi:hypothetical protein